MLSDVKQQYQADVKPIIGSCTTVLLFTLWGQLDEFR